MNFLERYLHKNSKLETGVNFKRYQKYHNTQKLYSKRKFFYCRYNT